MQPSSSDLLMRGRLFSLLASSASSRRVRTPSVFSSVEMGENFHSEFSLQTTMTKKGKKRKLAETEAVNKEEERKRKRKEGSGGGCASYLHLRLEIGEGGRGVDLSPEYMESHLIMALK